MSVQKKVFLNEKFSPILDNIVFKSFFIWGIFFSVMMNYLVFLLPRKQVFNQFIGAWSFPMLSRSKYLKEGSKLLNQLLELGIAAETSVSFSFYLPKYDVSNLTPSFGTGGIQWGVPGHTTAYLCCCLVHIWVQIIIAGIPNPALSNSSLTSSTNKEKNELEMMWLASSIVWGICLDVNT